MVDVRQLELNLDLAFEIAAEVPEEADVRTLWTPGRDTYNFLSQRPKKIDIQGS